jgi:hypothetical protein
MFIFSSLLFSSLLFSSLLFAAAEVIVFDILYTSFVCGFEGEKKKIIPSHSSSKQDRLFLSLSLSRTHTHFREREKEKEKPPRALFVFFVIKILLILLRLLHAFFYTDSLERRRRR